MSNVHALLLTIVFEGAFWSEGGCFNAWSGGNWS